MVTADLHLRLASSKRPMEAYCDAVFSMLAAYLPGSFIVLLNSSISSSLESAELCKTKITFIGLPEAVARASSCCQICWRVWALSYESNNSWSAVLEIGPGPQWVT